MMPTITRVFAAFCDRCAKRYLSGSWPNHGLCGHCYTAAEKAVRV